MQSHWREGMQAKQKIMYFSIMVAPSGTAGLALGTMQASNKEIVTALRGLQWHP